VTNDPGWSGVGPVIDAAEVEFRLESGIELRGDPGPSGFQLRGNGVPHKIYSAEMN
jgi:hypothetical protein